MPVDPGGRKRGLGQKKTPPRKRPVAPVTPPDQQDRQQAFRKPPPTPVPADQQDRRRTARKSNVRRGAAPTGGPGRAEVRETDRLIRRYEKGKANTSEVQRHLRRKGFDLRTDGVWGPQTQEAWKTYLRGVATGQEQNAVDIFHRQRDYLRNFDPLKPANAAYERQLFGPQGHEDLNRLRTNQLQAKYANQTNPDAPDEGASLWGIPGALWKGAKAAAQLPDENFEALKPGETAADVALATSAGWADMSQDRRKQQEFLLGEDLTKFIHFEGGFDPRWAAFEAVLLPFRPIALGRAGVVGGFALRKGVKAARTAAQAEYRGPGLAYRGARKFKVGDEEFVKEPSRSAFGRSIDRALDRVRNTNKQAGRTQGYSTKFALDTKNVTVNLLRKATRGLTDAQEYSLRVLAEGVTPEERMAHHLKLAQTAPRQELKLYHLEHAAWNKEAAKYVELNPAWREGMDVDEVPRVILKPAVKGHTGRALRRLEKAWGYFQETGELRQTLLQDIGRLQDDRIMYRLHAPGRVVKGARFKKFEEKIQEELEADPARQQAFEWISREFADDPVQANAARALYDSVIRSTAEETGIPVSEVAARIGQVTSKVELDEIPELGAFYQTVNATEHIPGILPFREMAENVLKDIPKSKLPEGLRTPARLARKIDEVYTLVRQGADYKDWYVRAARVWGEVADELGIDRIAFAKVVGIYSQQANPTENLRRALTAVKQYRENDGVISVGITAKNGRNYQAEKAMAVLEGGEWEGRKTNSYFGNALKHLDPELYAKDFTGREVTVDRHIAAMFDKESPGAHYDGIERIFQEIADTLGWAPEEVQAAAWVPWKARTLRNKQLKKGTRAMPEEGYMPSAGDAYERGQAKYKGELYQREGLPPGVQVFTAAEARQMPADPSMVYHGTSEKNAESILTEGVIRQSDDGRGHVAAWFAADPTAAAFRGDVVIAVPRDILGAPNVERLGVVGFDRDVPLRQITPEAEEVAGPEGMQAVKQALEESPYPWSLTAHTDEELFNSRIFLTPDSKAGFVISPEGELQNVFNNSGLKGLGDSLVSRAVDAGATHLDAFDIGPLPELYGRHGFKVTERLPFDPQYAPESMPAEIRRQKPDVLIMRQESATVPDVLPKDWEKVDRDLEYWYQAYDKASTAGVDAVRATGNIDMAGTIMRGHLLEAGWKEAEADALVEKWADNMGKSVMSDAKAAGFDPTHPDTVEGGKMLSGLIDEIGTIRDPKLKEDLFAALEEEVVVRDAGDYDQFISWLDETISSTDASPDDIRTLVRIRDRVGGGPAVYGSIDEAIEIGEFFDEANPAPFGEAGPQKPHEGFQEAAAEELQNYAAMARDVANTLPEEEWPVWVRNQIRAQAEEFPDISRRTTEGEYFQKGGNLDIISPYGIKGAVAFDSKDIARIFLTAAADQTTLAHELGHVMRRLLPEASPATEQALAKFSGAKITNQAARAAARKAGRKPPRPEYAWDEAAEEKFADGLLRTIRTGVAPPHHKKEYAALARSFTDILEDNELPDVPFHVHKALAKMMTGYEKKAGGRIFDLEDVKYGVSYAPTWRGVPFRLTSPHRAMGAYIRGAQSHFFGGGRGRAVGGGPDDQALRKSYEGAALISGFFKKDVVGPLAESAILASRMSGAAVAHKALVRAGSAIPVNADDIAVKIDPSKELGDEIKRFWDKTKDFGNRQLSADEFDPVSFELIEDARRTAIPFLPAHGAERAEMEKLAEKAIDLQEPIDNIVWVPKEFMDASGLLYVPQSAKYQDVALRNWMRKGGLTWDVVNDLVKAQILWLNPAYAPVQFLGNTAMNLMHQGPFAMVSGYKSVMMLRKMPLQHRMLFDTWMGEGIGGIIKPSGALGGLEALHRWNSVASDIFPRRMAFMHEARRDDYKTFEQLNDLAERALAGDPAAIKAGEQIARRAKRSIVDFDNLTPLEREVVARWIFFYPWLRAASDYSVNFIKDHPLQAATLALMYEHMKASQQDILGDHPYYSNLDVPISTGTVGLKVPFTDAELSLSDVAGEHTLETMGPDGEPIPNVFKLRQAFTQTTPLEIAQALYSWGFKWDSPESAELINFATPTPYGVGVALFGYDPYEGKEVPRGPLTFLNQVGLTQDENQAIPVVDRIRKLFFESEEQAKERREKAGYPRTKVHEALRVGLGSLAPTPYNTKIMQERAMEDAPTLERKTYELKSDGAELDLPPPSQEALEDLEWNIRLYKGWRSLTPVEKAKRSASLHDERYGTSYVRQYVPKIVTDGDAVRMYESINPRLYPRYGQYRSWIRKRKDMILDATPAD